MVTKAFAFAGRASFVVENPQGESVTVKLAKSAAGKVNPYTGQPYPETFFVSVRHNNHPWVFAGKLNPACTTVVPTKTTQAYWSTPDGARTMRVAQWALQHIQSEQDVPTGYRLAHTGRCGKCGKLLRDAESIALGLGPVCRA